MDGALGLPVLVSRVLAGLAAEVDDGGGGSCSLPVWSNVVRVVGDGTSERDLAVDARISRRLAVSAVTGAARRGWVTAAKAAGGRQVGLTPAGRAPKPDEGLPGHGQDWRPVRRAGGGTDTVSWVPLTALLSQCLVAFAIDYEGRPAWPLASTTLVVRHLGVAPMPLADAPADHGITGNGKSLLERHGIAVVEADPSSPRRSSSASRHWARRSAATTTGSSARWRRGGGIGSRPRSSTGSAGRWRRRRGRRTRRGPTTSSPRSTSASGPATGRGGRRRAGRRRSS